MKKMHSLVSLNEQSDLYFFQNFEFKILKHSENSKKNLVAKKKSSKNYLYLISLFDQSPQKNKTIFQPKKVPPPPQMGHCKCAKKSYGPKPNVKFFSVAL